MPSDDDLKAQFIAQRGVTKCPTVDLRGGRSHDEEIAHEYRARFEGNTSIATRYRYRNNKHWKEIYNGNRHTT